MIISLHVVGPVTLYLVLWVWWTFVRPSKRKTDFWEVGRYQIHLIPQTHLDNYHIRAANTETQPENWQNTFSMIKHNKEATSKRIGRLERWLGAKHPERLTTNWRDHTSTKKVEEKIAHHALQTQGTCTWKTNPHNIWFWKPMGLNYMSLYNQWYLTLETLKISRLSSGGVGGW